MLKESVGVGPPLMGKDERIGDREREGAGSDSKSMQVLKTASMENREDFTVIGTII